MLSCAFGVSKTNPKTAVVGRAEQRLLKGYPLSGITELSSSVFM